MLYDWLWVGLGNPGDEYQITRHNAGFLVLDSIKDFFQKELQESRSWEKKQNAFLSVFCFQGVCILLCKPLSYMNLSGTVVSLLLNMHNIPLRNLVVFHDELELGFGTLRWKIGGGHKGHNGIRNISERCGSDYNRFRVGIGRPSGSAEVSKFVLGAFTPKEKKTFENFIFPVVHQTIPWIIQSNNDKVCGILKETSLLKSSKLSEQF